MECGEGIDCALDDQGGSGLLLSRDPESAAGFSGSGRHAMEGWSGAGAAKFGADGLVAGISGEEDGIGAEVGAEDALLEASVEDCGIEAFAEGVSGAGWRSMSARVSRRTHAGAIDGSGEGAGGRGSGIGGPGPSVEPRGSHDKFADDLFGPWIECRR